MTPVIVGVGQLLDRPSEDEDGLEPLELMVKAIAIADKESGNNFLPRVDSLDIENVSSWTYADLCQQLTERLHIQPKRRVYHDISGDSPTRNLCKAAARIAKGESQVALICGAEAAWTVRRAHKNSRVLASWTPQQPSPMFHGFDSLYLTPYGVLSAAEYYALFENAYRYANGQSFEQAQNESAELWSRASEVAVGNEYAWIRKFYSAAQIQNPSDINRMISWPYTKLMVANNFVNGGTAILLTSLELATEAGIPMDQLIYIARGAYADERDDVMERERFDSSAAMQAVLESVAQDETIDLAEIYSCFPCVPKLARGVLKWPRDKDLTITGGMTFCGGQVSNFMSQAIVSMVTKLREGAHRGLVYGNGHFLTHASALLLSNKEPRQRFSAHVDVQSKAEALMKPAPSVLGAYTGPAVIETYTVAFDTRGQPERGLVIARTPDGHRFGAVTRVSDSATVEALLQDAVIGTQGYCVQERGLNFWRLL